MKKYWDFDKKDYGEDIVDNLQRSLSCPRIIAKILIKKDITTKEASDEFFYADVNNLNDPFLFKDMEKAVDRIIKAIKNKEKIIIYGDYDVDGTTATSILLMGLKQLEANVDYYIPNRMIEGYGLSRTGNKALEEKKANLVITVDCGINAVDEIDYLINKNIDVIVTDHHTPKEILPKAYTILDPKLKESGYPYKELSGAGIALKLIQAISIKYKRDEIPNFYDLAGLGTIADIVPLNGENRILAKLGLDALAKRKNLGLSYLMNLSGLKNNTLKSSDVVFRIAPRINAAGRIGSADRAVELMTSTSLEEAQSLAMLIHKENQKRQKIDQKTFQEASNIIEAKYKDISNTYFIVLASENWHPGVVGIVASKIVEKYNRPTILITLSEGEGNGSGRSIHNFNIFECLSKFREYLISFGGHKYAAGINILPEYIDILEEKLNKYAQEKLTPHDIQPRINICEELELQYIDDEFMKWLKLFAPFGPANMNPIFMTKNVQIVGYPYIVGNNHLKLKTLQNGKTLNLIGFNMGELSPFLKKGSFVDIAYSLEENEWRNIKKIQGKLKDIKPYEKR